MIKIAFLINLKCGYTYQKYDASPTNQSITHLNSHSINLTIIKLALNYTVLTYF